jgi:hypothetical protein
MKTLDEAWQWYNDVKASLRRMHRLSDKYWDAIPWTQPPFLGDERFVDLQKDAAAGPALNGINHLDDLAVVVLFSVFEGNVRQTIIDQVDEESDKELHRVVLDAIQKAKERIEVGSFFAILEPFKGTDDNLIEQVSQVRRYRNWVAHGKRKQQPAVVRPDVAYQRLKKCLELLFPPVPDSWIEMAAYYVWEKETRSYGKQTIHWNKAKVKLQEMVRTGKLKL